MATRGKKVPAKKCIRCNRTLTLDDFFPHKLWASQMYRDAWCKDCAKKFVHNHEDLMKYCFENNRKLTDAGWEGAKKKAKYALANNRKWIDPATPQEERDRIEEEAICQAWFNVMNLAYAYEYEENLRVSSADSVSNMAAHEFTDPEDKPRYDTTWRGWFTPTEIKMLDEIYAQYEQDFVLDNVNIQDYARKVAKASLNADVAEDKMRRGQITAKEYKEAQDIFDGLSKSSNFAACRRKPGETTGMGSLGEIILRLETQGYLDENPYTFPDDDVDKVIQAYKYTLQAVGMELR